MTGQSLPVAVRQVPARLSPAARQAAGERIWPVLLGRAAERLTAKPVEQKSDEPRPGAQREGGMA